MRAKSGSVAASLWLVSALALAGTLALAGQAVNLKVQVQLVWGTNESKPPEGKDYKPLDPDIEKKLQDLPLKWKHYFEVRRKVADVPPSATVKVPISDKCELEITRISESSVE